MYFLYYAGTIQEQALALMGEKEAASQALEGTFDTNALRAMMNGGESDDIIAALANSLETGKKVDAKAAWKTAENKPVVQAKIPISRVAVTKIVSSKSWAQGFLFDINAASKSVLAGA